MAEKNSEKSFSYYLNEIANLAEFLKTYPDGSITNIASTINDNISELKKALTGIRLLLLFMFAISFICISVAIFALTNAKFRSYFVYDNIALKDSLLDLKNKNTVLSYRLEDGKIVTYNNLAKENDLLIQKVDKLESDIRLLNSDLELCNLQLKSSDDNATFYRNNSDEYRKMVNDRQLEDLKELTSKKVDSGKILLDAFRSKMKFDPKTKTWTIDVNKK